MDIDSLLASGIRQNYISHVSLKFLANTTRTFQIKSGSLYTAVDKLKLIPEEHVIIVFGRNLDMDIDHYKIDIQTKTDGISYEYQGIPIFKYSSGNIAIDNSFFILNKKDLPMITNRDWSTVDASDKAYWATMKLISEDSKLYFRYKEIIEGNEIYNEYLRKGRSTEEIHNKVEVILDLLGYCWFRKNIFMLQLKETYKLQEGGKIDVIEKLKTFAELLVEHNTKSK